MKTFADWLNHHVSRFPKLDDYLQRDDTIQDDWRDKLSHFSFEDLKYATSEMMSTTGVTWWADQQLGHIIAYARTARSRRNYVESAPDDSYYNSVRCSTCRDVGTVRILAVEPDQFTTFADLGANDLRDCVCACLCSKGSPLSENDPDSRRKPLPAFSNRAYVYDYELEWEANVAEALKHYKSFVESKRHSEFLKYSEAF